MADAHARGRLFLQREERLPILGRSDQVLPPEVDSRMSVSWAVLSARAVSEMGEAAVTEDAGAGVLPPVRLGWASGSSTNRSSTAEITC